MYDSNTEVLTKDGWRKVEEVDALTTLMGVAGNEMLSLKPLEINSIITNKTVAILTNGLNINVNHNFFYASKSCDLENISFDMIDVDDGPFYIPQKFLLVEDDIPALPEIQKIRCFLGISALFLIYAVDFDREFILLKWDKKEEYLEDLSFYAMFLEAEILIDEEEKTIRIKHDPFVLSGLPLIKINNENKSDINKCIPNWFLNTPILAQSEFLKMYVKHQQHEVLSTKSLGEIQSMGIQCGMSLNFRSESGGFVETEGFIKIESEDIVKCDQDMKLYSIVTTPSNLLIFRKNGIAFIGHGGLI